MAYKKQKFGDYRERINFAKSSNTLELADLLEIQKKSYQNFIENGIKEVFEDLFPVESFTGNISLEFTDYSLEEPRYSIKEAKERMVNYAAPLKVQARLYLHETGEVKEQEIFLGDLPLMTDAGTFIINGAERVIVSQLVRSPSIYFKREIDKNGRRIVSGEIIPNKGTWLEYETDAKGVIYVRIDRTRKVAVTTFLRALGLSTDEEIIELFGDNEFVKNTLEKDITNNTDEALLEIYEKLRPGEPATIDSAKNQLITRFFDRFRYDLAKVGRYKFNKKMFICERILGCTLAENIKFNGEEIAKKGDVITKDILEKLKVAFAGGLNLKEATINEELDGGTASEAEEYEAAVEKLDAPEYVKDMGTPERYYGVCKDYEKGIVQAKNLSNKQKAIFLDRDGTINKYVGFLRNIDEFELLPGVIEAIKKINASGYLAIVVTNQPVIARGEVSYGELEEIHNKMETLLGEKGAYIDAIYYCPHHPDKGYDGEIPELKFECDCRKPKPGMLWKAATDFNVDLSKSWMIGDGENDVLAGKNARCKTGYIKRENKLIEADITGESLLEVITKILN